MSVLVSRSSPECHLYIQLHPCECGERELATEHKIVSSPNGLVARYAGTCGKCGRQRTFEFVLDPDIPPADAFGGSRASTIICPGEWLAHSDQLASRWPAAVDAMRAADVPRAREDLAWAIRALEEVVKFVPAGAEAVPASAFTSASGRAIQADEPGRFRVLRLEARLTAYRQLLTDLDGLN